jgi:hypothetical protein
MLSSFKLANSLQYGTIYLWLPAGRFHVCRSYFIFFKSNSLKLILRVRDFKPSSGPNTDGGFFISYREGQRQRLKYEVAGLRARVPPADCVTQSKLHKTHTYSRRGRLVFCGQVFQCRDRVPPGRNGFRLPGQSSKESSFRNSRQTKRFESGAFINA